jgi:hypothetical protein
MMGQGFGESVGAAVITMLLIIAFVIFSAGMGLGAIFF